MKLLALTLCLALAGCSSVPQKPCGAVDAPVITLPDEPMWVSRNLPDDTTVGQAAQLYNADITAAFGYIDELKKRIKPYTKPETK